MRALYIALVALLLVLPACGSKLDPGQSTQETQPSSSTSDPNSATDTTDPNNSARPGTTSDNTCNPNAAGAAYAKQAATVINTRCATCHRPNGTQPRPDLSTYTGAKTGFQNDGLQLLDSKAMPPRSSPSGQLTKQEQCILDAWAAAGYQP